MGARVRRRPPRRLALAACSDRRPGADLGRGPGPAGTGTKKPKPSAEPSQTPTPSPTTDDGTTVPVYWVGDGPGGEPRLFREFHRVQGDPLVEAARLVMGGGQPDDPDYRTLWPEIDISDCGARPTASSTSRSPPTPSPIVPTACRQRDAKLAVQQLVYTLQGVQQERIPVAISRPDTEPRLFGLPTDDAVRAGQPARDPQPRQHHLARGGRHRHRRHPDGVPGSRTPSRPPDPAAC